MKKYYVACIESPDLEYKRFAIDSISDFISALNFVKNDRFYNSITIKEYSDELDTCVDCLGVDIFTWNK